MAQQATTRQVVAEAAYVYDGPLTVRQVIGEVAYEQRGLGQETRARQVLAEVAWTPVTGDLYANGNDLGEYEGDERGVPLSSDRSAWDDVNYPERHAKGMEAGDSHHPVVTLSAEAADVLALVGQELDLETQVANTVFAGPASGADAKPAFRALVEEDLPPHPHVEADITDLDHTDEDAIHDNVAGEIHAIAEKETLEDDDEVLIEDSSSGYVKKRVKISNLPAGSGGSGTLANAGYQETVGDGVNTEFTVTHSLGTWDVLVQVYDLGVTPREQVGATVEVTSVDAVVVTFESAPDADQFRVLVVAADVGTVSDAADLTYTPVALADWDGAADPGNADDAFDQLAERVTDLEAGGGGGGDSTHTAVYASRPAASNAGDLFLPSNGVVIERDTGAAWVPWGPLFPMATPPTVASLAWVNQGAATADETNGGIYLLAPANASYSLKMLTKAAPATPYTVTAWILPQVHIVNYNSVGLCWRQSSDGKIVYFGRSGPEGLIVQKATNPTTFSASYLARGLSAWGAICLRIADDGTNRKCFWSLDGQHFHQFHSVGRTDFLTADEVGFYAQSQNATYPAGVTLLSWKEG